MTNFEKIKAMTVEEMAEWLEKIECDDYCHSCIDCPEAKTRGLDCKDARKAWLEQEADNDN